MFTSERINDQEHDEDEMYHRTITFYWISSLFILLFSVIYEHFSYGVYSSYMLYAFLFPLLGGVLIFSLLRDRRAACPEGLAGYMYHCGLATLTVGSIVTGILEIYGTTNRLTQYYWYVGIPLVAIGIVLCVRQGRTARHRSNA